MRGFALFGGGGGGGPPAVDNRLIDGWYIRIQQPLDVDGHVRILGVDHHLRLLEDHGHLLDRTWFET